MGLFVIRGCCHWKLFCHGLSLSLNRKHPIIMDLESYASAPDHQNPHSAYFVSCHMSSLPLYYVQICPFEVCVYMSLPTIVSFYCVAICVVLLWIFRLVNLVCSLVCQLDLQTVYLHHNSNCLLLCASLIWDLLIFQLRCCHIFNCFSVTMDVPYHLSLAVFTYSLLLLSVNVTRNNRIRNKQQTYSHLHIRVWYVW